MDCVEGAEGDEQALLTLHFATLRFQIYVLLGKKDSEHVVAALDWLEGLCGGKEAFKKLFGLILADRGSEFDDIAGIEKGGRCSVYYTDPQRPDQKGACEKAHVELRKVIGKGASIDGLELEAWLVAGICSHVISSMRLSIGDASPMALAKALPTSTSKPRASSSEPSTNGADAELLSPTVSVCSCLRPSMLAATCADSCSLSTVCCFDEPDPEHPFRTSAAPTSTAMPNVRILKPTWCIDHPLTFPASVLLG
jgi:hypothetical protein